MTPTPEATEVSNVPGGPNTAQSVSGMTADDGPTVGVDGRCAL